MDLALSDEQQMMQATARAFAEKEIVPFARDWDRTEVMDPTIVGKLGDIGFLGATIPAELGGSPCDNLAYCLMMEELGRADSSVRGVVSVSLGLVTKTLLKYASDDIKQRWIPQLCAGATVGCFCLTEPGTGSDAGNLETRATRDGDDWLITGNKQFITNGNWAGVGLVFARTGGPGARGVSVFAVDMTSPGITRTKVHGKLGLRAQDTAEIAFDEVRVPDSSRVGELGEGFKIAMAALGKGRMSVAAACVGIAQACLDASLQYTLDRIQFGRPIAGFQLVQEMLADMSVEIDAARLMVWKVADLIDRHEPHELAASKAKLYCSEVAVRAANNAIQLHGGYGFVDEYPVGRYMRDARVTTLYEGTSQVQKLIIGRALTGLNAFN
ncbi:MAG: acyl-CoA dehydrogenase family protein [Acidimicrobiia bacterium]